MTWTERKARMDANKAAIEDKAVDVCEVLREQARGGLGYFADADEAADAIEEILLSTERWEDPARAQDLPAASSVLPSASLPPCGCGNPEMCLQPSPGVVCAAGLSPAPRATLEQLVENWRREGERVASFHATMGSGWFACADDLAALLRHADPQDQP